MNWTVARAMRIALVSTLLLSSSAAAQDGLRRAHVLTVARGSVREIEAVRVALEARRAVLRLGDVDAATVDVRIYGDPLDANATLARARELAAQARHAFDEVDFDSAVRLGRDAASHFERSVLNLADRNEPAGLLMTLGASLQLSNREDEALRIYRRLHTQYPDFVPDALTYNPEIIERFGRADVQSAVGVGQINVRSDTAGGIVYVDGRPVGLAPAVIDGVAAGEHSVGVLPFGGSFSAQLALVEPESSKTLDFSAASDLATTVGRIVGQAVNASALDAGLARRFGRAVDAELAGLLRVMPAEQVGELGLELVVVEVASGQERARRQSTTEVIDLERATDALVVETFRAALSNTRVTSVVAEAAAPPTNVAQDDGSITKKWWLWTAVAGGSIAVAAAVVGVVLATSSSSSSDRGEVVLQF